MESRRTQRGAVRTRWSVGVLAGALVAATVAAPGVVHAAPPPPAPVMYVGDVRVTEGQYGQALAKVPITLSAPLAGDAYFAVRTLDDGKGQATPNVDYKPRSATKRLRAGATSMTLGVPVMTDRSPEALEQVLVEVEALDAPPVAIVKPLGTVTIVDDDPEPGDPDPDGSGGGTGAAAGGAQLTTSAVRLYESDTAKSVVPVTFRLSTPQSTDTVVTWKAVGDTASPGSDFKSVARRTTIKAGRVQKSVGLPMYHDDIAEADEQMRIVVTAIAADTDVVISDDPLDGMVYMLDDDADADGDGLEDAAERFTKTDPFQSDTDGDGLSDGDEVRVTLTNPHAFDTDGDGFGDLLEIKASTDPLDPADHPTP